MMQNLSWFTRFNMSVLKNGTGKILSGTEKVLSKVVLDRYWNIRLVSLILFCLLVFFQTACTTTYAPVEQRGSSYGVKYKYTGGKLPDYHFVKKGDTLYSIAWKYGLDYKQIAYNNRIKPPYRIFKGQKLRLSSAHSRKQVASRSSASRSSKKTTSKPKVSSSSGRYKESNKSKKHYHSKSKTSTKTNSSSRKKTAVSKTTGSKTRSSKQYAAKRGNMTKAAAKTRTATFTGSKRLKWKWPVKGKIIQRYSPGSGKKGIDISAPKGTLIKSAEAGKVVYSGQGLVGYGRLVIIKHNDTYLSAYAHNQQLLVNEGQLVKKGQSIARLGRSGTDRYKLHFEIRKNGKPVNPVSYLPH